MVEARELAMAARVLKEKFQPLPGLAIILGSGLGDFVNSWEKKSVLPYSDIPGFSSSTVQGHKGQLVAGFLDGLPILAMQGRLHYYEGYSMKQIVFPVEALQAAGIKKLIVTNAAGAVNDSFSPGDLMLITDHINFMANNPLLNRPDISEKFIDLSQAYDPAMRRSLETSAKNQKITLRQGVYIAVSGPVYETPAEIRMYRALGADACGMSTIPEVITANRLGLPVSGISCITNMGAGITGDKLDHAEVTDIAGKAMQNFTGLLRGALRELA